MAARPVYRAKEKAPYFEMVEIEFTWNGGFAKSQKQKNIQALHEGFQKRRPGAKVLEISSKSMQEYGEALSAFFLPKYVPDLGRSIPVECVFQAGKVFKNGGPYRDLMTVTPREAKRDERLKTSGSLVRFTFDGHDFQLVPKTFFYDYIYINALLENEELARAALQYDAFTDIEFNPDKSLNCQAKAAATFVSLSRMGLVDKVKDPDTFLFLYRNPGSRRKNVPITEKETAPKTGPDIKPGTVVKHKKFGEGQVVRMNASSLVIQFPEAGEKELGRKWCETNCEFGPQDK